MVLHHFILVLFCHISLTLLPCTVVSINVIRGQITRALPYCYIEMKAFYDTNMKKTSIKYRLSNIKSFLYPVGAKALLFLFKITCSVAPKQDERSSAVSR